MRRWITRRRTKRRVREAATLLSRCVRSYLVRVAVQQKQMDLDRCKTEITMIMCRFCCGFVQYQTQRINIKQRNKQSKMDLERCRCIYFPENYAWENIIEHVHIILHYIIVYHMYVCIYIYIYIYIYIDRSYYNILCDVI